VKAGKAYANTINQQNLSARFLSAPFPGNGIFVRDFVACNIFVRGKGADRNLEKARKGAYRNPGKAQVEIWKRCRQKSRNLGKAQTEICLRDFCLRLFLLHVS